MSKRLGYSFVISTSLFILLFTIFISYTLTANAIHIYVNQTEYTADLEPQLHKGEIIVKSRALAQILEAEIHWSQAIRTLTITKDDLVIKMMENSPFIQINNQTRRIGTALVNKDGNTYIPLIELAEIFSFLVEKDNDSVYISKPDNLIREIKWLKEDQLMLKMDKLSPYRIYKSDDHKEIIIEIAKTGLADDFQDNISNNDFYLKKREATSGLPLQLIISSKYIIPFQLEKGIEEDGDNLIINFLPYISSINWKDDVLKIRSTGEIEQPEISLLQEPRRLVIDIPNMMLNNIEKDLPDNQMIKDIRVSQYMYDPIILRIVIDLKNEQSLNLEPRNKLSELVFKPSTRTRVTDLTYSNEKIEFKTCSPISPDIFTLKEPDRLVINLLNTVKSDDILEDIKVDNSIINTIRTARFNEETVRIVLDLKQATGFNWIKEQESDGYFQHTILLKDNINQIKIFDVAGKTDLIINFSGELAYEVSKLSNPDRLVVDVKDLVYEKDKTILPELQGLISDIRISQFSQEPPITRFVFELEKYYAHELFSPKVSDTINISLVGDILETFENIIVIDPGHGGFDPGAIGPTGLREKDIALDIAKTVSYLLQEEGYEVLMTREDDTFVSLRDRVNMANDKRARLFVSIHINASNQRFSEGTETYVAPNKLGDSSSLLADLIQENMVKELRLIDRGVKVDNLYVLRNTIMPAALAEVAFISNPHEEALLSNEVFRGRAARAIARGIRTYLQKTE